MRYLSLLALLILTGCATMITGTSTDVAVSSDPPDAEITVDGRDFGETPATIALDSGRRHTMELSLDGYETETIQLQKTTSGWLAGNILFGGIPGLIIDAASGGMYVLSPKTVNADLDGTETSDAGSVSIRVAMDVKEKGLRKIGELTPTK